jgi:large subunit ribosomal protein L22
MEAIAKLKNVPTSPRKMRLVANLVRGKSVAKALGILKFEPNSGAARIEKLLLSALSNWQLKNEDAQIEDSNLYVKQIFVDEGKMLKRLRPAPQGRGYRIRKRSNHVTLVLDSMTDEQVEQQSKKSKKAKK